MTSSHSKVLSEEHFHLSYYMCQHNQENMWALLLLVLGISFLLPSWLKTLGRKEENQKSNRNGKEKTVVRLGFLDRAKVAWRFLTDLKTPNYEMAHDITKQHGKVVYIDWGGLKKGGYMTVADLHTAKEVLKTPAWVSRFPDNYYWHDISFGKPIGLIFGNGLSWKTLRKTCLKNLNSLYFFNPSKMEPLILSEVYELEDTLLSTIQGNDEAGAVLRLTKSVLRHSLNVVFQVLASKRFAEGDPLAENYVALSRRANFRFAGGTSVLELLPWLRFVPNLTFVSDWYRWSQYLYEHFQKILVERKKIGTYLTDPRDLIDYMLIEAQTNAGKDDSNMYNDEYLLVVFRDFILGGTGTTSASIEHALLYISLQPAVQKNIQEEIDLIIGPSRQPTYADKAKMIFTQAVLLEVYRLACPVPVAPRTCVEDTYVNGNLIPQGSLCGVSIYSVHRDPDIWEEPEKFRPERFLNEQGDAIVNADKIIPFGSGRRVCIAEQVAQVTLFLFLVRLLQKFTFELSDKHPPPSMKNSFGLTRAPLAYYVKVRARNDMKEESAGGMRKRAPSVVIEVTDFAMENSKSR